MALGVPILKHFRVLRINMAPQHMLRDKEMVQGVSGTNLFIQMVIVSVLTFKGQQVLLSGLSGI